ncbi:MAG TPA: hypothetical protein VGO08_24565, partial [Burkholderiales bacterium]|nr:hypothetical protein [Burkholderiales bacterium]
MFTRIAPVIFIVLILAMSGAACSSALAAEGEIGGILLPGEEYPVKFQSINNGGILETVSGKRVGCSKEEGSGTIDSATTGKGSDDLTGCKKEKVACRSENKAGEKDPVETALIKNLQGAIFSMKTSSGTLAAGIANTLSENLIINCGGVKDEIKGTLIGLVSPTNLEIAAGEKISFESKQEKGKQITGTCLEPKAVCETIAASPL